MTCSCASALAALAVEVAALRREVAALRGGQTTDGDDELLSAIAATTRGHVFNVAELVRHADAEPTGRLASAIVGRSARSVGKALAANVGDSGNGVRVERCGRERDGTVWICVVAPRL